MAMAVLGLTSMRVHTAGIHRTALAGLWDRCVWCRTAGRRADSGSLALQLRLAGSWRYPIRFLAKNGLVNSTSDFIGVLSRHSETGPFFGNSQRIAIQFDAAFGVRGRIKASIGVREAQPES